MWRNCFYAWGGGRWTSGRRAFFRLSCDWAHRNHRRHRAPGKRLRNPKGVHWALARATVARSFVDQGCWTGRKTRCKRGDLCTPDSTDDGHARSSLPVAEGPGARKTAKRSVPRGSRHFRRTVNDMPSFRPQCSLAWNRLAALEVSGAAPAPKACSSGPAILGKRDASGSSSGPALHEARTPMGASAGSSRIFSLESHFARPHQKPMRLTASLSTPAKYLQSWLRSWTGSKADVH